MSIALRIKGMNFWICLFFQTPPSFGLGDFINVFLKSCTCSILDSTWVVVFLLTVIARNLTNCCGGLPSLLLHASMFLGKETVHDRLTTDIWYRVCLKLCTPCSGIGNRKLIVMSPLSFQKPSNLLKAFWTTQRLWLIQSSPSCSNFFKVRRVFWVIY